MAMKLECPGWGAPDVQHLAMISSLAPRRASAGVVRQGLAFTSRWEKLLRLSVDWHDVRTQVVAKAGSDHGHPSF